MSATGAEDCRVDVWLWRARFCKTRALAARLVEDGRVRLTRGGAETRLDKPSRCVRAGDILVFVLGGRVVSVLVERTGERRGPAAEARTLYSDPTARPDAPAARRRVARPRDAP